MARTANYDAKIASLQEKIDKEAEKLKQLKQQHKDTIEKKHKDSISKIGDLFVKFDDKLDAEALVKIVNTAVEADIALADVLKMVQDEAATRPAPEKKAEKEEEKEEA